MERKVPVAMKLSECCLKVADRHVGYIVKLTNEELHKGEGVGERAGTAKIQQKIGTNS